MIAQRGRVEQPADAVGDGGSTYVACARPIDSRIQTKLPPAAEEASAIIASISVTGFPWPIGQLVTPRVDAMSIPDGAVKLGDQVVDAQRQILQQTTLPSTSDC